MQVQQVQQTVLIGGEWEDGEVLSVSREIGTRKCRDSLLVVGSRSC